MLQIFLLQFEMQEKVKNKIMHLERRLQRKVDCFQWKLYHIDLISRFHTLYVFAIKIQIRMRKLNNYPFDQIVIPTLLDDNNNIIFYFSKKRVNFTSSDHIDYYLARQFHALFFFYSIFFSSHHQESHGRKNNK